MALAQATGLNRIQQGDYRALLDARPGQFAAVTATDVLEHLTKAEVLDTFDRVAGAPAATGTIPAGRVPNAAAKSSSASHWPSRSRTWTASGRGRFPGYLAAIAAAISGSGSGHATGCTHMTYPILRPGRRGKERPQDQIMDPDADQNRVSRAACRELTTGILDEAKTIFLATVSHELRTPLTSIVSFSELMRAETNSLTADGSQFLDIIERNAHRLLHLVGDLLLLSRLESGSIPLDLTAVSIPQLTEEAARAAAAGAAKRGVTVHFSADDGPLIQADRTRLAQVLDNLIANAVKFSRPNGLVRVDAIWDGDGWGIDVADTGIGIPPEEIGQLFGRFVRASNARTAGLPGTGLGLSIVKAITELHGGRVTVDSTLGSGTTFSVYLPARTAADPESPG